MRSYTDLSLKVSSVRSHNINPRADPFFFSFTFFFSAFYHCSGSVCSVCFRASWIRIRNLFVRIPIWLRIQILQSTSKKYEENLDICLLFCDFFITFYLWKWCKCTFNVPPVCGAEEITSWTLLFTFGDRGKTWFCKKSANAELSVSTYRYQCSGSVTFWYRFGYESSSADPYIWLTDPDPALFINDLHKTPTKFFFVLTFFA